MERNDHTQVSLIAFVDEETLRQTVETQRVETEEDRQKDSRFLFLCLSFFSLLSLLLLVPFSPTSLKVAIIISQKGSVSASHTYDPCAADRKAGQQVKARTFTSQRITLCFFRR